MPCVHTAFIDYINLCFHLQVDINGHCTFSDQLLRSQNSPRPLVSIGLPRIAPFWVDLNVFLGGNVYYRVLSNATNGTQPTLASISNQSSAVLFSDIEFNAKWALLVTWDHVPYFENPQAVRQRTLLCACNYVCIAYTTTPTS